MSTFIVFCAVAGGLEPVAADPPPRNTPAQVPAWAADLAKGDKPDDFASPGTKPATSAPEIRSTPLDAGDGDRAASLPAPGAADVTLAERGAARRAGRSPVQLAAGANATVGSTVRVEILDQKAAERAGVHGFAFRLADRGAQATAGRGKRPVTLTVDYSSFADLYGADYAGRLRVVALPACAVADPVPAGCDRAGKPLTSRNDQKGQKLVVAVDDLAAVQDLSVASTPPATASPSTTTPSTTATSSTSTSSSSTTTTTTTPTTTTVPAATDDESAARSLDVELASTSRPLVAEAPGQTGGGVVLALSSGPEGPGGSFKATGFEMSGDWQVGVGSGDFTWSQRFPVVAAPAAGTPDVTLSYSSGAVDGMVSSKNTQPGNVGLGWGDFANAYIERHYNPCSNEGTQLGDLCWAGTNASISLNGQNSDLVQIPNTNVWHLKSDPRWKVEALTSADYPGVNNGDNNGEHWKVTTPDGTQYWFGVATDPEGDPENPFTTASTWTVPVVGDDASEPCNTSPTNHVANLCVQAWRWNLDRVVDPNGNERWYQYVAEKNHYRAVNGDGGHGGDEYIRGGYLKRIWYGTYSGESDYAASVIFDLGYRCETLDDTNPNNELGGMPCPHPADAPAGLEYPDTPLDMQCSSGWCEQTSPTFFAKERYTGVHVCVRNTSAGGACQDVDYFKLSHRFSSTDLPGEETDEQKLFLTGIQRIGHDPGPTASPTDDITLAMPPTTFGWVALANRHLPGSGETAMRHWRINRVTDEFGRQVNVTYGQPHPCPNPVPNPPKWDLNTKDCFPQLWGPEGEEPTFRAFNKYVVTQVEVKALSGDSPAGAAPPMVTKYLYGNQINTAPGAPQTWVPSRDQAEGAWHQDQDVFAPQAYKSWSEWRGYQDVLIVQGQARTRYKLYRGMDDDVYQNPEPGGSRDVALASLDGTVTNSPDSNWLAGRILDQASLRPDGSEEAGVVHKYQTIITADAPGTDPLLDAHWVAENDTIKRMRTPASGAVFRRQRNQTTFNALLTFPETMIEHGWDDVTGDERCTKTEYVINVTPTLLLLDYPQRVTRYNNGTACSGTAISRTETAYDGGAVGAAPTKGNATTKRVQTSAAPSPNGTWSTTTIAYDRFGRPTSETDPNGHVTTTLHGTNNNDMGHPDRVRVTNPAGHEIETTFTYGRNLPAWSEDANNKRDTFAYDALGRIASVWQPGDPTTGPASWQFAYDVDAERDEVPVIQSRQLQDLLGAGGTPRYIDAWAVYDSLLRVRQTHSRSPDSAKTIVADTTYDAQGRAYLQNVPEAITGAPGIGLLAVPTNGWRNYSQTLYDHMNRVNWELFWADDADTDLIANTYQRSTITAYTEDTVTVDPLVGGNTRTKTDGLGRTVEVAEHDGTAYRTTAYTHNKADNQLSVTDAAGNKINYTYDLAGRRLTSDDPDAGDWSFTYDPGGNQLSATDALNVSTYTKFDLLNRPTETRKDNPTSGQLLSTWSYDAPGELGLLDRSTRVTPTGNWVVDVAGYDARNRPTGRSWDLPNGITGLSGAAGTPEFTVNYGYDKLDHPTTVSYPAVGGLAAETITTTYDAFGLPDTMTGLSPYVSLSAYDDRARPALFGFGSSSSYSMAKFWQYDLNQRLSLQQTSATGGGLVQDRSTKYDLAGNVIERNTTLSGASARECMGYDQRNRLTSAYTTAPANTCASGTGKGTGANPYNHTYSYSHDGNIQARVEGGTPVNYTYPASGPTSTRPHAPTQVGSNTYTWNANGNQTGRTIGGQAQTLTWDADHLLASVNGPAGNNTFTYDAEGTRVLRQTPAGTTFYFEGHEVTVPAGSGTAAAVRSYGFGSQAVATRNPAGVDYLVADNQGSIEQTIPSGSTTADTTRTYFPYGKVRTGGQPDSDHTWIGQVEDDTTGLQYLNARYYDPATSTFTAPDPLTDPSVPTTFNAYQYALNNPTTNSDPSGALTVPDGGYDWKGHSGGGGIVVEVSYHDNQGSYHDPTPQALANEFAAAGGGEDGLEALSNSFYNTCNPDGFYESCKTHIFVLGPNELANAFYYQLKIEEGQARARHQAWSWITLGASFIPAVGEVMDLKDAISSAMKGDWTGAAISTAGLLPVVSGKSMKGGLNVAEEALEHGDEVADAVTATKRNYRDLFRKAHPGMPDDYQVHHALPQKFRGTMADAGINIDETEFLRGIDPKIHSKITTEWGRWERGLGHAPSADEITAFSYKIDEKYGDDFIFG